MKGKRMNNFVLPDDIDDRSKEINERAEALVKYIVETNNLVISMQSDDKLAEFLGHDRDTGIKYHHVRAGVFFLFEALGPYINEIPVDALTSAVNSALEECLDLKRVDLTNGD